MLPASTALHHHVNLVLGFSAGLCPSPKCQAGVTTAPQVLLQLATKRNAQPLPEISKRFGLLLPPEDDCLTAPNYNLAPPAVKKPAKPHEPAASDAPVASTSGATAEAPREVAMTETGHILALPLKFESRKVAGIAKGVMAAGGVSILCSDDEGRSSAART